MHALGLLVFLGLTTAPPPPQFCIPAGFDDVDVERASFVDGKLRYCLENKAKTHVACGAVDPVTGRGVVLQPDAVKAPPAVFDVSASTNIDVSVCRVGGACQKFRPIVAHGEELFVHEGAVSADGTMVAVHIGADENIGRVEVWDIAHARKVSTINYAAGARNCGKARMLGTTVAIEISKCKEHVFEPQVMLYRQTGELIGLAGDEVVDLTAAAPLQVAATKWLFVEDTLKSALIIDVKTGKLVQRVPVVGNTNFAGFALIKGATPAQAFMISGAPAGSYFGLNTTTYFVTRSTTSACAAPAGGR